jgi:hypothetical protein
VTNKQFNRPPKPDTGREYIWSEIAKEWIDVTPKTKNIVRFVRKKESKNDQNGI